MWIKKFYNQYSLMLRNLILYGAFGIFGAGIDYMVYCVSLTFLAGNRIIVSSILGNIAGFCFTFITNTFLNFKKKDRMIFRFGVYALTCCAGSAVSALLLSVMIEYMNPYISKIIVMMSVSFGQFIINKFITYRE